MPSHKVIPSGEVDRILEWFLSVVKALVLSGLLQLIIFGLRVGGLEGLGFRV